MCIRDSLTTDSYAYADAEPDGDAHPDTYADVSSDADSDAATYFGRVGITRQARSRGSFSFGAPVDPGSPWRAPRFARSQRPRWIWRFGCW